MSAQLGGVASTAASMVAARSAASVMVRQLDASQRVPLVKGDRICLTARALLMSRRIILHASPLLFLAISACHDRPTAEPAPPPVTATAMRMEPAASQAPTAIAEAPFTPEKVTGEAGAMGTHLAYAAFTTRTMDAEHVRATFDAATAEIGRLEKLMTTWQPDSEVSQVNAAAGECGGGGRAGDLRRHPRGPARERRSREGCFDITFETLHGLWKFDQDLDPHPPTDADVKAQAAAPRLPPHPPRPGEAHRASRQGGRADRPRGHRQGVRGGQGVEGPPRRGHPLVLRAGRRRPLHAR